MNPAKHLRGLDQDLARQTKETKKMGGPSDALRRMKKRPENKNWRLNALYGCKRPMGKCDKCGAEAEIRSIINGEIEYQLCRKCFGKR